jgi:hypothetical protein
MLVNKFSLPDSHCTESQRNGALCVCEDWPVTTLLHEKGKGLRNKGGEATGKTVRQAFTATGGL